jgi:hypothetical protein
MACGFRLSAYSSLQRECMADVGQGLLTIGSVSVGAGLTYLFTALNRSHQEARGRPNTLV